VDCLSGRLCGKTSSVLDRSHNLVSHTLVRQLIVPGCSPETLFELAREITCCAGEALLGPPKGSPACSVLDIVVSGRVFRTRLIKNNVRSDTYAYTGDNPGKSFHSINLLKRLDADTAVGVTEYGGR
jgi:hypothetical protein